MRNPLPSGLSASYADLDVRLSIHRFLGTMRPLSLRSLYDPSTDGYTKAISKRAFQEKSRLIAHEVPRMCNASQCIVELNGSVRIHFHLSSAFSVGALIWIMSENKSAQSLDSLEDEVGDLFCLRVKCFSVTGHWSVFLSADLDNSL